MAGGMVTGWKLDGADRAALLARFPPAYPNVVADHVTLKYGGGANGPVPPLAAGTVVGHADDGRGVECLVVAIHGTTDRPDGSTYHITWSLGPGRAARESNVVLREQGWAAIDPPIPVALHPGRW